MCWYIQPRGIAKELRRGKVRSVRASCRGWYRIRRHWEEGLLEQVRTSRMVLVKILLLSSNGYRECTFHAKVEIYRQGVPQMTQAQSHS